MPAPPVMDARTFATATKIGVFKGRKSLEDIDTILGMCAGLDGKLVTQRLALMSALMEACQAWLSKKALKTKGSDKGESANTAKRRGQVEIVLMQAQRRFAYERFEIKKQQLRTGVRAPLVKGLQSGYIPERIQFTTERTNLRSAGQYTPGVAITPIGGSYAHEMHKQAAKGNLPIPAHPHGFDAFTVADYEAYKRTGEQFLQAPLVHYMRKEERLGNMLVVKDGKLWHKGALFSTGIHIWIYVMDVYGNLFVQNSTQSGRMVGKDASQFNHSSLNAGNSVICAGVVVIEGGVLKSISNESGHYAPSHRNLEECVRSLIDDGLNVSQTTVSILTAAPDSPYGPWPVNTFLANPDACLTQPVAVVAPPVPAPVPAPAPAPTHTVTFHGRPRGHALIGGARRTPTP